MHTKKLPPIQSLIIPSKPGKEGLLFKKTNGGDDVIFITKKKFMNVKSIKAI